MTPRRRKAAYGVGIVAAAVALFLLRGVLVAWFTGGSMGGGEPGVAARATAGGFTIEAAFADDPPRQDGNSVRLHIRDGAGEPVNGDVSVEYVMPAMGSMAEMRGKADVVRKADGRYEARFDLPMAGSWTLVVAVAAPSGSTEARYSFTVGAAGLNVVESSAGAAAASPGATTRPSEPRPPVLPAVVLPQSALAALRSAFEAYELTRALLAQDRVDGLRAPAQAAAKALRTAVATLGSVPSEVTSCLEQAVTAAERLARATSVDEARAAFGELSRFLVALAASDPRLQEGWHVFRCPMAQGFTRWMQKSPKLENPYMGQAMLTCGSATEWSAAPSAATPDTRTSETGSGAPVSHAGHGHEGDDPAFYTCSMHPSVKQKQPGSCPICGMQLTPVTHDEHESGVIFVDEGRRDLLGITTAKVVRAPMAVEIRAVGRLTYDETRLKDVTLKLKGWISRLHVEATGQPIRMGQPLLTIYSPELYAAQQEYLLALRSQQSPSATPSSPGGAGGATRSDYLVRGAEQKLRLWDLTPSQIASIAKRGEPIENVPILSPASGFVIEKDVVEGAAVEPGQRLFRIAALDKVWVEADVYEAELHQVKKGQSATVTLPYLPGRELEGKVAYVYPYLDPKTRTGRVRIELANKDLELRPDMYATVSLKVDLGEKLQIPVSAVLYTGPRRLVFVDLGEGRLRPQEVELGSRTADRVAIEKGLEVGQTVVKSGNFLVAAESRIRSASQFWTEERAGGAEAGDAGE